MGALQRALHFGLEEQRQRAEGPLIEAIRGCASSRFSAAAFSRIVDYRYSLEPLSTAGSLRAEGGRFNVGAGVSPGAFTPFPALYCAADYATAYLEKFGSLEIAGAQGLSGADLALRTPGSFTYVRINVSLENFLDISDHAPLKPIVDILREFQMPKTVLQTARRLSIPQKPWLMGSPHFCFQK
jgi:hypothetical protein